MTDNVLDFHAALVRKERREWIHRMQEEIKHDTPMCWDCIRPTVYLYYGRQACDSCKYRPDGDAA